MRALSLVRCGVALAVTSVLAPSWLAGQAQVRPVVPVASLFPLEEGNWWVYERHGATEMSTWRVEVGGVDDVGRDRRYFHISGYFQGPPRMIRRLPPDMITEYPKEHGRETLWYLLGVPVGTTWELRLAELPSGTPEPACISGSRLRLVSRVETVRVPAGEFSNAVRVDWEPPCADAGVTTEWFVPGIGLVKRVESSIAGAVTSELQSARVGSALLPRLFYTTALTLDRPVYWNNLMPPVGPDAAPLLRGALVVENQLGEAIELQFVGCRSVTVEVRDGTGETVLRGRGDDGGCCQCENIITVSLARGALTVPFSFRLAAAAGTPLPEGVFTVHATLDLVDLASKPSASARIEVRSAY